MDDRVEEVEVMAPEMDAQLHAVRLVRFRAADVLRRVAEVLGQQPVSAERQTSFEFGSGLRLWRPYTDGRECTSAVVFRPR